MLCMSVSTSKSCCEQIHQNDWFFLLFSSYWYVCQKSSAGNLHIIAWWKLVKIRWELFLVLLLACFVTELFTVYTQIKLLKVIGIMFVFYLQLPHKILTVNALYNYVCSCLAAKFYRQIAGDQRVVGDHRVAKRWKGVLLYVVIYNMHPTSAV